MELQLVHTYPSDVDAQIAKSKLESEGIECYLHNENFSNMMPYLYGILGSGVQLKVRDVDYEKAIQVLRIGAHSERTKCPNCLSENVEINYSPNVIKPFMIFLSLILQGLIGNLLRDYKCAECGEEFRM